MHPNSREKTLNPKWVILNSGSHMLGQPFITKIWILPLNFCDAVGQTAYSCCLNYQYLQTCIYLGYTNRKLIATFELFLSVFLPTNPTFHRTK